MPRHVRHKDRPMSGFNQQTSQSPSDAEENDFEEAEAVEVCLDYDIDDPSEVQDEESSSSDEEVTTAKPVSIDTIPHHINDLPHAHATHHTHHLVHRQKTIYFIRHGVTEANAMCMIHPWDSDIFRRNADLWDTRLCEHGRNHAISLNRYYHEKLVLRRDSPTLPTPVPFKKNTPHIPVDIDFHSVEAIFASPLTRALQTSELLFYHRNNDDRKETETSQDDAHMPRAPLLGPHVKKIVHPLMREQLFHVSEAGRSKAELLREFPSWDMVALPDDDKPWWYTETRTHAVEDADGSIRHVTHTYPRKEPLQPYEETNTYFEPEDVFSARMAQLKEYLLSRPEKVIIVVSHAVVMESLLGGDYHNCHVEKMHY